MGIVRIEDAEKFVENLNLSSDKNLAIQILLLSILDEAKKPNMRIKIKEYLSELEIELERCINELQNVEYCDNSYIAFKSRIITLGEVKNDLASRLDELI